ncbi:MAG: DUF6242 domain-containing protein [Bacteroidales bacterium]
MRIKRFFTGFLLIGGLIWVSSCKDSNETDDDIVFFTDAQISAFKLEQNDSVMKDLNLVTFLIDQNNGQIFNPDSLPYKTEFEKLLANITFLSASTAKIYTSKDTTDYSVTDSIDFREPVKVIVTAQDSKTTKEYIIKVNVHQQLPDSMVWAKIGNNIYNESIYEDRAIKKGDAIHSFVKSKSGISLHTAPLLAPGSWTKTALTSLPLNVELNSITLFNDKYWAATTTNEMWSSADGINWAVVSGANVSNILGIVTTDKSYLFVLHNENGKVNVMYTSNGTDYKNVSGGSNLSADQFPSSGYTTVNFTQGATNYLSIIGGTTSNSTSIARVFQCSWNSVLDNFHLSNNLLGSGLPAISGASSVYYNDGIYLFGGKSGDKYSNSIYTSVNGGINWEKSNELVVIPEDFGARESISVIENANRLWLIGGNNESTIFNDIWTAKINKLK